MSPLDTIAAIATPLGQGGLAVVRLSGPRTLEIAGRVFTPAGRGALPPGSAPTHTVHYGHVRRAGQVVDEVLLTVLRAPRTYTREDMVEISCHGGLLVARRVLDTLLEQGARLALPGEFTRRAFLNGRIDLSQAEAVADLIHARTGLALAAAHEQLAGHLSQRVSPLRDALMLVLAHVEARIDFPEEDIEPETRRQLLERIDTAVELAEALLRTAHEGQILRTGIRAALAGPPNAGKSSLLNLLLGHDRAMVSPLPGTTRDTIQETADIRGIPVVLVDTAGLRESGDALETEGVRRTCQAIEKAELVIHVLDTSDPFFAPLPSSAQGKKQILVLNKSDLPRRLELPPGLDAGAVRVSCLTGEGLEPLKDAIYRAVWSGETPAGMWPVMINARHQDALRRAKDAALRGRAALEANAPLDLAALDLRQAASAAGEIAGQTSTEDLLDRIFSQFCIGK